MALTYSTIPAVLLAGLPYVQRHTAASLDQLVNSGSVDREAASTCAKMGGAFSPAQNVVATLLGLILGSTQVSWMLVADNVGDAKASMMISIAVGNLVTWLAVVHVMMRRGLASLELRRLGREHTKVDLLRLDALLPFGRIGTFHLLMVVLAFSLSVFQARDAECRWVNYSAALAAAVPAGIVLLLLPMIGVQHNVREARRRALEKLDHAIAHADRALEPEPLRYLGDLLKQRDALQHARTWPLDTTALSRIAIYFIIPPLAWVGGAIVEIALQTAIEPGP